MKTSTMTFRWPRPYPPPMKLLRIMCVVVLASSLSACAVIAVADAAVTVAATGVKVVAKTVGAVVDVVTPEPKK